MLAKKSKVTVEAVYEDGTSTFKEYGKEDIEQMVATLSACTVVNDDPAWAGFLEGFADCLKDLSHGMPPGYRMGYVSCLDVLSAGMLSSMFPLGSAIRAFVDMSDPDAMPGMITDAGKLVAEDAHGRA